ncbi:hypothetical protein [Cyanobium sp. WAJ14-Wanaka]|uniref:hypothetical protein n=1 Tax=Cyanobium sp. WAJ14-Wanaka TaxID=2823725 RepID=UPI0020CBFAE9|nr:hypothetical protein [Cyanobium sp. WAJ14-Wanaka]MCP9776220.1 hypothetical protein [Cyanobium sp. WAJ14-Wanaka]
MKKAAIDGGSSMVNLTTIVATASSQAVLDLDSTILGHTTPRSGAVQSQNNTANASNCVAVTADETEKQEATLHSTQVRCSRTLRHWLGKEETWEVLVRAGATAPRKVAAACGQLWPKRPPSGTGVTRTYSWPEMQAIAAHLSGEVQ